MILNFTVKIYKSNMPGSRLSLYSVVQSSSSGNKKNKRLKLCENARPIEEIEKNSVDYSNEKATAINQAKGERRKIKIRIGNVKTEYIVYIQI